MIWEFSDGTTFELGGNVAGASLFAQRLRTHLEGSPLVALEPLPTEGVPLDVNDAALCDAWLQQQLLGLHGYRVTLTQRPDDVPALPLPESEDEEPFDGDLIY
ncbi:MAG: hypothetical protein R3337_00370 [Gammaproteobacteria bacterium]|nr:hypothetical protein [Gammaproteobacteria bacterium]